MSTLRKVAILGSTGSIGQTTLDVIRKHPNTIEVVGLCAGKNVQALIEQIKEFKPKIVGINDEAGASSIQALFPDVKVFFGDEGHQAAVLAADLVVCAIVGAQGLKSTHHAASLGKTILLANKESLVVAGQLIMSTALKNKATILPIDSEHSAIFQCLETGQGVKGLDKIILTASGGPFFLKPEIDFKTVRVEDALKHPNWSMGNKITIDSATMMNKGLEAIEAFWLFQLRPEQIEIIVHPQSIIHSMVQYIDGSVIAQLSVPDMSGPIAYALYHPNRASNVMNPLKLSKIKQLTFFEPDHERFKLPALALKCLQDGPTYPCVLNAANEVCVEAFLNHQIRFYDIPNVVSCMLKEHQPKHLISLEAYLTLDREVRMDTKKRIEKGELE